jgi:hypothetical protein
MATARMAIVKNRATVYLTSAAMRLVFLVVALVFQMYGHGARLIYSEHGEKDPHLYLWPYTLSRPFISSTRGVIQLLIFSPRPPPTAGDFAS